MLEFYGWWDWLFHANVTSGISSSVDYRKSKVFTQRTRGRRTSGCTVQETNHHLSFLQEWGCSDGQCPVWATKINRLNPHLCSCSNPKFSPSLSKADFPKACEDIDKHHGGFTNTSLQAGCLSAPVGVLWLLSEGTLQMSLLRSSQILPSGTEHFHASEREQWAHIQGWDWTPSRVGKRICCVTKIGQVPCHIWQMPQMAGHGFGGLLKSSYFHGSTDSLSQVGWWHLSHWQWKWVSASVGSRELTIIISSFLMFPSLSFVDEQFQAGFCRSQSFLSSLTHRSCSNLRKKNCSRLQQRLPNQALSCWKWDVMICLGLDVSKHKIKLGQTWFLKSRALLQTRIQVIAVICC